MIVKTQPMHLDEIETELRAFEDQYQVPSHRLVDAFRTPDGVLRETSDFLAWSNAWAAYKILAPKH